MKTSRLGINIIICNKKINIKLWSNGIPRRATDPVATKRIATLFHVEQKYYWQWLFAEYLGTTIKFVTLTEAENILLKIYRFIYYFPTFLFKDLSIYFGFWRGHFIFTRNPNNIYKKRKQNNCILIWTLFALSKILTILTSSTCSFYTKL